MRSILIFLVGTALIAQALLGLSYFISCIWEKEKRATIFAAIQFTGMLVPVLLFFYLNQSGFFDTLVGTIVLAVGIVAGAVVFVVLWARTGANQKALQGTKGLIDREVKRFDERAHVFARNRSLRPDSEQYKTFYQKHPELESVDSERRKMGGPLGHPGAIDRPHETPNVSATLASLSIPLYLSNPDKVKPTQHFGLKSNMVNLDTKEASERAKGYTLSLGADLVGITKVNPLWLYSHRGEIFHENWEGWGKEIESKHPYAVVFATEMSFQMIASAPHTPTAIESMGNYAQGAFIAIQLANYIANLGYSATAHHLRHYELVLVPLAVDAGLGEMGRLGYLMTKRFGPRVRLGAVTTDLPMIPDKPVDIGVGHFCKICKKCAICCPSNSISLEDQTVINGTLRWKLNAETCFAYWGKVGTDCNVCMRVCPWSHADTFPHKVIKEFVSRNKFSRHLFSKMDDIFYGKKPGPKAPLSWTQFGQWQNH